METLIEVLSPGTGGLPENGVDGGGAIYTVWDIDDEAQFTAVMPDRHDGGPIGIKLEALGTSLKRHQWRLRLSKAGIQVAETYATFAGYGVEANETIEAFSGSAGLDSGDTLTFSLKRVTAPSDEDPAGILIYGIRFYAGTSVEAISECSGRLGKIVDGVLIRFNDAEQKHVSQTEVVVFVNDLIRELSQRRIFRRSVWIDLEDGQSSVSLDGFGADVLDLVSMSYQENQDGHMWNMQGVNDLWEVEKFRNVYGPPRWYHVLNGVVEFAPKAKSGGRLGAIVAIQPAETDCERGTLPTPNAYDQIYTYYCLRECHGRDWTATGARDQWSRYNEMYESELSKLMGMSVGNYRRMLGSRSIRYFRG